MSQFVNLEEGTSGQLPTGHRNGTHTEVSGHIQNSGVEVQGISSSSSIGRESTSSGVEVQGISSSSSTGRESTRPFYGKVLLPLVKISPYIWCANKISIEPFFLYYSVINYERKCVEIDNTLGRVNIFLIPFNVLIIIGSFAFLARGMKWRVDLLKNFLARPMERRVGLLKNRSQNIIWFFLLLNDLLSNIPGGPGGPLTNAIWPQIGGSIAYGPNFFAASLFLLQYFLMVILFYIMFTRDTRTWATLARATWAKATFNLLLYIHGGHVFGGLWYAFAIGKEIECWEKACKHYASECARDHDFFCDRNSRDYKFINEFCPTKTRNTTAYDFGIYHDALQSGIVEMWNFPRRVLYCFRWGLQNLSGFGQNIQTSTDAWENIFVISITIYGMVLFVFFIGNMQIYLQSQTNRSEMIRQKKHEIEQSKSLEKLPENLQKQIKRYQPEKWEETEGGVEFGNLFNNLPGDLKRNIKRHLCLELLKKVEEFTRWSEELLHELCDCAKPVSYAKHAEIVRSGSPIYEMLFLVQGKLLTWSLTSINTPASPPRFETSINHLEDGEFCGEELVALFQADLYSSNLPISTKTIQTTTKVDAFSLMYYDLQNLFIKHQTARSTSTQVQEPSAESRSPQAPLPPAESLAQQLTSRI